jgi:pyrroloquinoline quinone biosynthesis protein E
VSDRLAALPFAATAARDPWLEPPIGLLAELTHRCPLQCPYCSNPVELEKAAGELTTEEWVRVLDQADELGVLQVHLSGGEPAARRDLEAIVRHAAGLGLYTNLITSGVLLDERRVQALKDAGLDHVQLSLQGANPATAERVSAYRAATRRSSRSPAGSAPPASRSPSTPSSTARTSDELEAMVDLSLALDAHRLEVAHVQYYGWALRNRAA